MTQTVATGLALTPATGPRRRWLPPAVAGVLTVTTIVLHAVNWRCAGGLWRDEVNSVVLDSSPTFPDVWADLHNDSFPLLWHLLLRGWVRVGPGSTDPGIRLMGLCTGLGVLAALWWNARRFGRDGGSARRWSGWSCFSSPRRASSTATRSARTGWAWAWRCSRWG